MSIPSNTVVTKAMPTLCYLRIVKNFQAQRAQKINILVHSREGNTWKIVKLLKRCFETIRITTNCLKRPQSTGQKNFLFFVWLNLPKVETLLHYYYWTFLNPVKTNWAWNYSPLEQLHLDFSIKEVLWLIIGRFASKSFSKISWNCLFCFGRFLRPQISTTVVIFIMPCPWQRNLEPAIIEKINDLPLDSNFVSCQKNFIVIICVILCKTEIWFYISCSIVSVSVCPRNFRIFGVRNQSEWLMQKNGSRKKPFWFPREVITLLFYFRRQWRNLNGQIMCLLVLFVTT